MKATSLNQVVPTNILRGCQRLSPAFRRNAIAAMLALMPLASHADTVTTSGTLSGTNNPVTRAPSISFGVSTVFTSYSSSFAWNYAIAPFYVGTSGIFSATSSTSPVVNTTWILRGVFSPSATPTTNPSTPLSDFIVQNFNGTQVVNFSNLSLTAGQQYSVLIAFNNTTSTFNGSYLISLSGPGCISFGLTNNCLAKFVPVSDQVTAGVANTLDLLETSGTLNGNMAVALTTMMNLPDDQRAIAEKRLTPQANNAQWQGALGAMNTGLASITRRLDGIRNAGALAWAEPDLKNLTLASAGPMNGLLEARELRLGAWGRVLGGQAKQDAMDGFAGYKANTWGLTLGADQRLESGTVVGAAFTYTTTSLDQRDFLAGSGSDVKNYQVTGYASRDLGKYYLDGEVSYGRQSYSTHRDTQVTGVATADFNGDVWAARIGGGIPIQVSDSLNITPIASLEYERLSQNGYTETGADVMNLTVDRATLERVRSAVGVQVAADKQWGGMNVRPSVHAKWLHDFKNNGLNTTAAFAGGGSAFVTPGQKIANDSANVGASLLFAVKKNAAVTVSYDLDAARGFKNQTAQLVGQVWF